MCVVVRAPSAPSLSRLSRARSLLARCTGPTQKLASGLSDALRGGRLALQKGDTADVQAAFFSVFTVLRPTGHAIATVRARARAIARGAARWAKVSLDAPPPHAS